MKTIAVIGAGSRGQDSYGFFIKKNQEMGRITAVVEPNDFKREKLVKDHNIPNENVFTSVDQFFSKGKIADAVIISTLDHMHYEQTMRALDLEYDILLEKPMSINESECREMVNKAEEKGCLLMVCHVLRFTSFFKTIKNIIESGKIGDVVTIQHNENVGAFHIAHSYVRGNWRKSEESSPIILAKSCHDLDILSWLVGDECESVASFGELSYFNEKNRPEGAALRCVNCSIADCIFDARKTYLETKGGWPANVVCADQTEDGILKALETSNYGRCVFACDNNVCDHQSTILKFKNGVTATFNLSGFTDSISRTIKVMGTKGEIRGNEGTNDIEVIYFRSSFNSEIKKEKVEVEHVEGGHNGGDTGLMQELFRALENGDKDTLSSGRRSLESHLMAFAAEEARVNNKVVRIKK